MDVHPQFIDVTFIDGVTDEIIGEQHIPYGADAVLPIPPVHEGYVFSYWQGDYTDITTPTIITAVYEQLPDAGSPKPTYSAEPTPEPTPVPQYPAGDADGNGIVEINDALLVLRYALGLYENDIIPICCDLTGDGSIQIDDVLLILRISMELA